ncbi:MAG: DUF2147 domain-containing protein [Brachymonas sp.]|nr:DUF2147 domain-containing protein [Brachymonas sp.]
MKKALFAIAAMGLGASVLAAEATPVGTWRTIDDATKEAKSEVVISDRGGVLSGRVTKLLRKGADPEAVCDKCEGDRKDKRIVGLEIIRGAKKDAEANEWVGGNILDPEKGKVYKLVLTPTDGGKKLDVRGYVGARFMGRTQTWVRVQ